MICENCGSEIDRKEYIVCYTHDKEYCIWCAEDRNGKCEHQNENQKCHKDFGYIPF